MTRNELKQCMRKIEIVYQNKNFNVTQELFDIWYECFGKLSAKTLDIAIMNLISKNIFPPSIAEIKAEYEQIGKESNESLAEAKNIFSDALTYFLDEQPDKKKLWSMFCRYLNKFPHEERMQKVYEFRERVVQAYHDDPLKLESAERYINGL